VGPRVSGRWYTPARVSNPQDHSGRSMRGGGNGDGAGAARAAWLGVLGWAAYLACSWTWCIGMFLPVLLVRDYGIWGVVVFAVPHVVGAGAIGRVLRSRASAARVLASHKKACVAFSIVTVLFQAFFYGW